MHRTRTLRSTKMVIAHWLCVKRESWCKARSLSASRLLTDLLFHTQPVDLCRILSANMRLMHPANFSRRSEPCLSRPSTKIASGGLCCAFVLSLVAGASNFYILLPHRLPQMVTLTHSPALSLVFCLASDLVASKLLSTQSIILQGISSRALWPAEML